MMSESVDSDLLLSLGLRITGFNWINWFLGGSSRGDTVKDLEEVTGNGEDREASDVDALFGLGWRVWSWFSELFVHLLLLGCWLNSVDDIDEVLSAPFTSVPAASSVFLSGCFGSIKS